MGAPREISEGAHLPLPRHWLAPFLF